MVKKTTTAVPPYLYVESYKGIGFHITSKGYLVFDQFLPSCRDGEKRNWSGLFSKDEIAIVIDHSKSHEERAAVVRKVIDRIYPLLA